jgi:hypothetical protein
MPLICVIRTGFFLPLQRMDARPTNVSGARQWFDVNKINT